MHSIYGAVGCNMWLMINRLNWAWLPQLQLGISRWVWETLLTSMGMFG